MEVAARPIGADQHQRLDGIARGLLHLRRHEFDAGDLRLGAHLVAERALDLAPVAIERRGQFAARGLRPVAFAPGRAAGELRDVIAVVLKALEERLPFGVDRLRVVLVASVEVFDVGGIAAVEERSEGESCVRVLAGHAPRPVGMVTTDGWATRANESGGRNH